MGQKRVFITADFKLEPVLLTRPKSKSSKTCWRMCFGRGSAVHAHSSGKELRDIQHSRSMILDRRFYIWFIMTLYFKMREILLQNTTADYYKMRHKFITKCVRFFCCKMPQFYCRMRQLLQNATIILQNATIITKCNVYYKLRQYIFWQFFYIFWRSHAFCIITLKDFFFYFSIIIRHLKLQIKINRTTNA